MSVDVSTNLPYTTLRDATDRDAGGAVEGDPVVGESASDLSPGDGMMLTAYPGADALPGVIVDLLEVAT